MKRITQRISVAGTRLSLLFLFLALLPNMATAQCPDNNHPHMIDLGLPSGTKWACCNVGAEKPEDYGGYYAWGETEEKDSYGWSSYIHCDGSQETCHDIGSYIFNTQYDVAHIKWGGSWVMPTGDQLNELKANCTYEWVTENGVNGYRFTGPNGAYMFIPASGQRWSDGSLVFVGDSGYYWSSSISDYQGGARALSFWNGFMDVSGWDRNFGNSVRPVAASLSIAIDQTNFPDENFRNYVLAQDYGQDGVLTEAEIAGMTVISVYGSNIADLKGIEYFTALMGLYCGSNQLTSLDVSQNAALAYLYCNNNQLTSLDVSKNTALTGLNCSGNQINETEMGKLVESLPANNGKLYVKNLNSSNEQNVITTTQVAAAKAKGWTVYAFDSSVGDYGDYVEYDGDAAGIPINSTTFPDENFRNWVLAQDYGQDGVLTEAEIAGVTEINVYGKNIASLKGIEYFTALTGLYCGSNQLTSLDVSQNTALTILSCNDNQLTSLDVSQNTALTELGCYSNQLKTLDVSKNTALTGLGCYSNQLTSLDVSKNTALTWLECDSNQLKTLDVSKNTALTELNCNNNQLTSLDVSKNTALISLGCGANPLTSLDVSQNTALTWLECDSNQLTSLDVSQNTALTWLGCDNNQLISLDVSKNAALTDLICCYNELTSLDVSKNTALTGLNCSGNQINETEMGKLVESLPANNGKLYVKNLNSSNEQNVITTTQVAAAKAKGWTVYAFDSSVGDYGDYVEYDGDEPTMEPIDTADFGSDIDEGTDLDGNVVGDILYNISSGDGSYNVAEGCIVVTTPTDDSVIDGQDIFGEDFQNNFTGIVFKVPAGKGTVKIEAQTTGTMVLKVKIGNSDPVEMELEGRLKVSFPYNVSEPTYVYIYGGSASAAPGMAGNAPATGELKLYGIEVVQGETGIESLSPTLSQGEGAWYTLDGRMLQGEPSEKGLYIHRGRKVVIK